MQRLDDPALPPRIDNETDQVLLWSPPYPIYSSSKGMTIFACNVKNLQMNHQVRLPPRVESLLAPGQTIMLDFSKHPQLRPQLPDNLWLSTMQMGLSVASGSQPNYVQATKEDRAHAKRAPLNAPSAKHSSTSIDGRQLECTGFCAWSLWSRLCAS